MTKDRLLQDVKEARDHFERSTRVLKEEHSNHMPAPGMFTVANQVTHVAFSIDWFVDGIATPAGFNMDFEEHDRQARATNSLAAARKKLDKAFARVIELIETKPQSWWDGLIPEGPIMPGAPRSTALIGVIEHTAHHRGALTVYSRTLGLVPIMPYMEPQPA